MSAAKDNRAECPGASPSKGACLVYFFCLLALFLLPAWMLLPEKAKTELGALSENRTLSELPEFEPSLSFAREFPGRFEAWFMDHLPFKTPLVRLNGLMDYYVFRSSSSDSVMVGKDGFLFYRGGQANHEDPVADYLGTNSFSEEELDLIAENLTAARDKLRERGTAFILFLPPNKERAYQDYMPAGFGAPSADSRLSQLIEHLQTHTDLQVVSPLEDIRAYHQAHPEQTLYYRTDTHWNRLGAYVAARSLGEALGVSMPGLEELSLGETEDFSGDLALQIGLSGILYDSPLYVPFGFSSSTPTYTPLWEGDGFRGEAQGEDAAHRTLLLAGDSFATLLYPYLGYYFDHSVSINYYDYTEYLLDKDEPDVFVLEVVERYLENLERFSLEEGIERVLD